MLADYDGARLFVPEKPKNLRALAIEALAKFHVWRNRFLPPIMFDVPVFINVAHGSVSCVILSETKNLIIVRSEQLRKPNKTRDVSLRSTSQQVISLWEIS